MKSREKPAETESSTLSEPIKVIKSDLMKNMLAAMNKHFEESSSPSNDEPVHVIECGGGPGVPPPPPPPPFVPGGNISTSNNKINNDNVIKEETTPSIPEPPKIGIPPPPPPPPPPVFDPNKVPKKPNKPLVKKKEKKEENNPNPNPRPSLKEQLMRVSLKKIGK
jgi:hypothetical protein